MMKKGQAALEFLTTYGWAFMVILVMISALAYFGILKPSLLLPDRCNFGSEIECIDYMIDTSANDIRFQLRNNVGELISVQTVNITNDQGLEIEPGQCADVNQGAGWPANWVNGKIEEFYYENCQSPTGLNDWGFSSGNKGKIKVKVTYYEVRSGSTYLHDVNGEIFADAR